MGHEHIRPEPLRRRASQLLDGSALRGQLKFRQGVGYAWSPRKRELRIALRHFWPGGLNENWRLAVVCRDCGGAVRHPCGRATDRKDRFHERWQSLAARGGDPPASARPRFRSRRRPRLWRRSSRWSRRPGRPRSRTRSRTRRRRTRRRIRRQLRWSRWRSPAAERATSPSRRRRSPGARSLLFR